MQKVAQTQDRMNGLNSSHLRPDSGLDLSHFFWPGFEPFSARFYSKALKVFPPRSAAVLTFPSSESRSAPTRFRPTRSTRREAFRTMPTTAVGLAKRGTTRHLRYSFFTLVQGFCQCIDRDPEPCRFPTRFRISRFLQDLRVYSKL